MKIAFILDRFPVHGGVEQMTIRLSSALAKRKHEVLIISRIGEENEMLKLLDKSVQIYLFQNKDFTVDAVRSRLLNWSCDVIINQGSYPNMNKFIYILSTNMKIPIISVLHNEPFYIIKEAKNSLYKKDLKSYIKRILFCIYIYYIRKICVCSYTNMALFSRVIVLLSKSYIPQFKLFLSHEISSEIEFSAIPNFVHRNYSFEKQEKEKTIIFVGRVIESQKKISKLLFMWKILNKEFPDWQLKIVGDGPDLKRYKSSVLKNNICNVKFLGYHNNPVKEMIKASLIVLTSDYEGFPLSLLEAMNVGCVPVLFNSFSVASEIIKDGYSGFLVPYDNIDHFLSTLRMLLNLDDSVLRVYQNNAIKSVRLFSEEMVLDKWEEILYRIV